MRQAIQSMKNLLELPWTYSALCILGIFVFPEYFAPILAFISVIFAYKDAKIRNSAFCVGTSGKLIWIYILCMCLSLIYSLSRFSTLATISMWIIMFFVYISLSTIITTKRRLFQFLVLLSIIFGLIGLIAILEYIGCTTFHLGRNTLQFWNFLDEQVLRLYPGEIHLYSQGIRSGSTFTNPNIFAEVMIFILPFIICAYAKSKQTYLKLVCIICLFFAAIGATFSFSRASYICILALVVGLFLFNPFRFKPNKIILFLLITVIILLLLIFIPNIYANRMSTLQPDEHSISERIRIWTVAFESLIAHPFLGYGTGADVTTKLFSIVQAPVPVPHAHNLFLQILLEGGFLSLAAFLIPTIRALFINTHISIKTNAYRMYSFASMAAIAMFFFFGVVEFPLLSPKLVGCFFMILSLSDITEKLSPDTTIYTMQGKVKK